MRAWCLCADGCGCLCKNIFVLGVYVILFDNDGGCCLWPRFCGKVDACMYGWRKLPFLAMVKMSQLMSNLVSNSMHVRTARKCASLDWPQNPSIHRSSFDAQIWFEPSSLATAVGWVERVEVIIDVSYQ